MKNTLRGACPAHMMSNGPVCQGSGQKPFSPPKVRDREKNVHVIDTILDNAGESDEFIASLAQVPVALVKQARKVLRSREAVDRIYRGERSIYWEHRILTGVR